jgi:serine/threonine-protein kinase
MAASETTERTLGRYRVVAEIGRGGMSTVHRAVDPVLKRDIALKLLAPALSSDPEAIARFQREATAVATLKHQAISMVYEFGEQDRQYYIAFEWVDGSDLRSHIKTNGKLDIATARKLFNQVADALHYAHERGVIHRDIKPANIILSHAGNATLVDFGLAWMADLPSLTSTGVVYGTPLYMAPEQVEGRTVDQRTDVYSLAFVLYEMLTGRTPFEESSTPALLIQQLNRQPPPLSEINPQIPVALDEVFAKATAKSSEGRYASMGEFRDAVNAVLPDEDGTVTIRMSALTRPKPTRRPAMIGALLASLGAVSMIGAFAITRSDATAEAALRATATAQVEALVAAADATATAQPTQAPQPTSTQAPPPFLEIGRDTHWSTDASNPLRNRTVSEFKPFGRRDALWSQAIEGDLGDTLGLLYTRKQIIASHKNGHVQTYDAIDGTPLWSESMPVKLSAPPVVCCVWGEDSIIAVPTEDGGLIGYLALKGEERWRLPDGARDQRLPGGIAGMTVGYDGLIYGATYNGWLVALAPYEGDIRWQIEIKDQTFWDAPVVSNAGIYALNREAGVVFGIDRTKQALIWSRKIDAGVSHNLIVSGDGSYLLVASPRQITALSLLTGEVLWTASTQHDISGVSADWGGVYVTSYSGHIYAFNVQDGMLRWQTRWQNEIVAPPLTDGSRMLISDNNGALRMFSVETGQEQGEWRIDSDGVSGFGPAYADGWLFTLGKNSIQAFAPGRP